MSLETPLARVRGLGSAKDGTHHWWVQRLTAIALIPLSIWFFYVLLGVDLSSQESARIFLAAPHNALLMLLYVLVVFYHAQLGLQVVIEDYIHARWLELSLLIGVKFLCIVAALAASLAVLRVALGQI